MSPRNVLYLISPLDFLFPSPANQGSASPPGSQTQTSPGSISKVLVGVSGIFPERVDPGTCSKRGNSLCLLDTKEFPSLDRGHPLSFREGTEMMTALPRGKFNPFPSCFKTRQGGKNYLGSSNIPRSPPIQIPLRIFVDGAISMQDLI